MCAAEKTQLYICLNQMRRIWGNFNATDCYYKDD